MNDINIYLGNSGAGVTANRTVSHANVRHGQEKWKDMDINSIKQVLPLPDLLNNLSKEKPTAGGQYDLTER